MDKNNGMIKKDGALSELVSQPIDGLEELREEIATKVVELCNWCIINRQAFMHEPNKPYTHPELIDTMNQILTLIQLRISKPPDNIEECLLDRHGIAKFIQHILVNCPEAGGIIPMLRDCQSPTQSPELASYIEDRERNARKEERKLIGSFLSALAIKTQLSEELGVVIVPYISALVKGEALKGHKEGGNEKG